MLYNVFHHKIFDKLYDKCPAMLDHTTFFGVNEKFPKEYNKAKPYKVVNEWQLPIYDAKQQANGYCQTSALYHVYRNKLYEPYDYVGCMQYDMEFLHYADVIIKQEIAKPGPEPLFYLLKGDMHIPRLGLLTPYQDEQERSCLAHYNKYNGTSWTERTVNKPLRDNYIMLHTFLVPKKSFITMMDWMSVYLEEEFPLYHKKISMSPAEFLERVHSMALAFEIEKYKYRLVPLPVDHIWPSLHSQTCWENYKQPLK